MHLTLPPACLLILLLTAASGAWSQKPADAGQRATGKLKTLAFTCRVLYEPAKSLWVRELQIDHDRKGFVALRIDGVPVHGFSAEGALIQTHLDNERISLDLTQGAWRSDFRDQASGQGPCLKERGTTDGKQRSALPSAEPAQALRPRT